MPGLGPEEVAVVRWLVKAVGVLVACVGCSALGAVRPPEAPGGAPKGILALVRGDFQDKAALVAMYNRYLLADGDENPAGDIGVSFPARSALESVNQLRGIEPPRGGRQTGYFSVADIRANLPADVSSGVEWIYYDLEGGLSHPAEVADPVGSIVRAAGLVHEAGLKFGFTVVNVRLHPREIVPYVAAYADAYNPQGQTFLERGCETYAREVGQVMRLAKRQNPSLRLWAQLSLLRGSVETNRRCLTELVATLRQDGYELDAVTVFYGTEASEVARLDQFYEWYAHHYRATGTR